MMEKFITGYDWLDRALPEGLPVPSSTVLIGPLEAGKPIIGLAFVSSWLRMGGGVIAAPLQFPDPEFASQNLSSLYGVDVEHYKEQFIHVQFDHTIDSVDVVNRSHMKANLVKPANWDMVVDRAKESIRTARGLMFFSTALNLPLFSPTYGDQLMAKFGDMFGNNESITYIICISTSMLKDKAEKLGAMADNEMEAYVSGESKKLRFEVKRMRNAEYLTGELEAPFPRQILEESEQRARRFRFAPVEKIKKI
jgi:KaiC/GvpD/RAD55 family RecA-like ATPase